ncbi:TonB-dependent receptor [Acinetobacter ursingii]|uniref:TonB-dependent receptor n=1 Tax=Acinetobacter ursingii TaxID=108980 RepID=A0AA46NF24_9GAMM|nr:TonB-dependent receptor [Acinetobacter ursingii]UYF70987.1 TonB-dependent receptor [Acinetobacter ursingii]
MKKNILFLSLIALPAFAFAEENVVLPTITVKADQQDSYASGKLKKKSNLGSLGEKSTIDTPFSVMTYSDKLIQDQQASTVSEVLRNDPSIRETTNAGHLNENVQIRGFAVGFEDYNLNGLFGMAPTGRIPTDILDSVTLLKGPNALVAGMAPAGSVGGVVMAQTKRATKDLTQVSAMYEDGGYYKSGFDVARRFGENKEFGARASASYGQGEHIIDGMDDKNASGVVALDYTTDKLKVNFDAYAIRDKRDNGSPAMVSMGTIKKVIAAPDGDTNYFSDIHGQQNSEYVGLSGEYKFTPNWKVYAGTGYAEKEYAGHLFGTRMIIQNAATGDATSQYYRVGSKEHNFAANTGFEGKFETGFIKHTLGLRADYLSREYSQHKAATSSNFNTNLYNPSTNGTMPSAYPVIVPYADNTYVSYTLTDQLSMLDDKLQLILGARYQDMDIKALTTNMKFSDDKVSPSIGIVVKPFGENFSFYGSYVEGLSQGKNLSDTTYINDVNYNKTFAPFQTKQYEVGAKYQLGSWLNTLALYQIEKPDLMTTKFAAADANGKTQITTDDAETRSRGIEWSFSGNIIDGLNVIGNLAYIDAEYKKALTNQGNTIYGIPKFTGSLGLDYAIPTLEGLNVNTRVSYIGDQYLNSTNTLKLPDYTIFDLGASYKVKVGGVDTTFRANVDNVANKKYWAGVFNDNYAIIGEARTYKLGVTFDF